MSPRPQRHLSEGPVFKFFSSWLCICAVHVSAVPAGFSCSWYHCLLQEHSLSRMKREDFLNLTQNLLKRSEIGASRKFTSNSKGIKGVFVSLAASCTEGLTVDNKPGLCNTMALKSAIIHITIINNITWTMRAWRSICAMRIKLRMHRVQRCLGRGRRWWGCICVIYWSHTVPKV